MFKLLTRKDFREAVFKRDNYACIICGEKSIGLDDKGDSINLDAHHIIERRLFEDGGYYIENGATLCETHHRMAETTELSCDDIREKIGIFDFPIPSHLYSDVNYDKWGNILIPNGTRAMGELFFDESVQKVIEPVLHLFSKYVKYPRTNHLSWSVMGKDDRQLENDSCFVDREVVVTLKKDGENTTFYNDYIHARSINSGSHPTRDYVKGIWAQISYLLDDNMRVCGENLFAKHTIHYTDLESYFYMFSMWINDTCLSWNETVEYSKILGLPMVETIYEGIYDKKKIIDSFKPYEVDNEGYVIRLKSDFKYRDFRKSIAKYVKPEFRDMLNNSHGHWISRKIDKNLLK
jgi:hypothetical protein